MHKINRTLIIIKIVLNILEVIVVFLRKIVMSNIKILILKRKKHPLIGSQIP